MIVRYTSKFELIDTATDEMGGGILKKRVKNFSQVSSLSD